MTEQQIKDLKNEMLGLYERAQKISDEKVTEGVYELNIQPMVFELLEMHIKIQIGTNLQELKRVGEASKQKYFMEDYVYPIGTLYYEICKEIKRLQNKVA